MGTILDLGQQTVQPQQRRARDRFEQILEEANAILETESGAMTLSIPELAKRLQFTRASIYRYFPTTGTILNELASRHLLAMENKLQRHIGSFLHLPWEQVTKLLIQLAAEFFNENPVGCMLILDGSTLGSDIPEKLPGKRLGELTHWLFRQRGKHLPRNPNVCVLAVEIGATCFRMSYLKHGKITKTYSEEAIKAMVAYLSPYIRDAKPIER